MNSCVLENLIILPCHSIWKPGSTLGDLRDEWDLVSFQIEGNDHFCFKDHIRTSIDVLTKDPQAALIISGGQTKKESGPVLESYSYYQLGQALMPKEVDTLSERILLEEYARDSFENVLFLICRFYEVFKRYPTRITVVGFEFKRQRFVEQHLQQALLFPGENIHYIGNAPNPEYSDEDRRLHYFNDIEANEARHARNHFEVDWYGNQDPLFSKKALRDPFHRTHGYAISNHRISSFLIAINESDQSETSENLRKLLDFPWISNTTTLK